MLSLGTMVLASFNKPREGCYGSTIESVVTGRVRGCGDGTMLWFCPSLASAFLIALSAPFLPNTPSTEAKNRDPIFALRMKGIEWVSPIGSPML
jgi:hypothetical protein